jgi:Domain of unknown function (DUF5122) beta-propeller
MRRRLLAAAAVLAALAVALPAAADFAQQRRVQINPVDYTPQVLDGEVRAFAQVGTTIVVGGDFTTVSNAAGTVRVRRTNIFAFDARTGAIANWAPQLDAPVLALAPGDGNSVYVGGAFQKVNGTAERALARLSLTDGSRYAGFSASANWGDVRSLISKNGWLYAAGSFSAINGVTRVGLARLYAGTGAVDANFDLKLAAPKLTRVKMEDMAITADGGRLAVVGAVQQVAGQARAQMFMVDTNVTPARLDGWYTDAYTKPCRVGFETYLRGVDFDPTGTYAVVVATGRMSGNGLMCDSAARFELAGTGPHKPTWVNYTGGDSLYSVSATGSAIYVGGHQRWMDNPQGHESKGPGAVDRSGIASIDPTTGKATDWNPGRKPRGVGARALLATPYGLLVGSDTENLGGERHARLGLLPL